VREKLTSTNQSIEKALNLIEILSRQKGFMRLQDLSTAAGMPASTILRLLNTLIKFNYVYQDPDSLKYTLTLKFAQIGSLVRSQFSISEIARPYLQELSVQCGEAVCLAIEQDMEVVYIDVVDGPDSMLKTLQRIGKRAPMHSTGVGKLMMTNYDQTQLDLYIDRTHLAPLTKHTITHRDLLLDELSTIDRQNYSLDNEECEIGARCIAAPVRDYSGRVIASISVSGPSIRMTMEKIDRIKSEVVSTALKISHLYGYNNHS